MNEDKLKQQIREQRDQYETEEPREGIWEAISAELHPEEEQRAGGRKWGWLVAASVAALLTLVLMRQDPGPGEEMAGTEDLRSEQMPRLSPEVYETQQYYARQVDHKLKQLSEYPVDADLKEEMDALAKEFEELQAEMGQGLDDSKVVEAMIDNYRLRLDLLQDLLEVLGPSDVQQDKNEGYEI